MSTTDPTQSPEGADAQRVEASGGDPQAEQAEQAGQAEQGAEAYGGDPDAEPSVTEEEVQAGMERDQTEG